MCVFTNRNIRNVVCDHYVWVRWYMYKYIKLVVYAREDVSKCFTIHMYCYVCAGARSCK